MKPTTKNPRVAPHIPTDAEPGGPPAVLLTLVVTLRTQADLLEALAREISSRPAPEDEAGPIVVPVRRAAELMAVDRTTAYARIKAGDWPAIRDGGRIRVPVAELRRTVRSRAMGDRR